MNRLKWGEKFLKEEVRKHKLKILKNKHDILKIQSINVENALEEKLFDLPVNSNGYYILNNFNANNEKNKLINKIKIA
mgnify:CR=1 FL=1